MSRRWTITLVSACWLALIAVAAMLYLHKFKDLQEQFQSAREQTFASSQADALYKAGVVLHEREEYREAISAFDKVIALTPQNHAAFVMRGDSYSRSGQPKQAIADYTRALELDPNNVRALAYRGTEYSVTGQFDQAMRDANRALELAPDDYFGLHALSFAQEGKNNLPAAIAAVDRIVKRWPQSAESWSRRANLRVKTEDYDMAIIDASQALKLKPRLVSAFTARGSAYYGKDMADEAIADLTAALAVKPSELDTLKALALRGASHSLKGNAKLAIADYQAARAIRPNNPAIHFNLSLLHYEAGEMKEALASLDRCLALNPDYPDGRKWRDELLKTGARKS